MDYKPIKNAMSYLKEKADNIVRVVADSVFPSGLELTVAGVSNVSPKKSQKYNPLEDMFLGYLFATHNYKNHTVEKGNGRVVVNAGDVTVVLKADSVKNSYQGYIRKKLKDNGVPTNSSLIRKLAKALQNSL